MVEGRDFGGEYSGCSTHPVTAEAGFTSSGAANQMTGTTTGWKVIAFVSSALSWTLGGVFWQQPCDAGIPICPHWFFIMRQQARSSVFISALGTRQPIAGAKHVTSNRTSTPTWRINRILTIRPRPPENRYKQRLQLRLAMSEPFRWRHSYPLGKDSR
jgi:hypothetical protein